MLNRTVQYRLPSTVPPLFTISPRKSPPVTLPPSLLVTVPVKVPLEMTPLLVTFPENVPPERVPLLMTSPRKSPVSMVLPGSTVTVPVKAVLPVPRTVHG